MKNAVLWVRSVEYRLEMFRPIEEWRCVRKRVGRVDERAGVPCGIKADCASDEPEPTTLLFIFENEKPADVFLLSFFAFFLRESN